MAGGSCGQRVLGVLRKTSVEPYIFFVMFALNTRLVTFQHLFHDRACRISLNFSNETCANLEVEENQVEQHTAIAYGNNLYNAFLLISTIPALVIATLLGPWSDRYSRKIPLLIATTGVTIDNTIQAVITSNPNASPEWYLLSAVFSGCSGGLLNILSCTYSYMSDITTERDRQTRYAILEFFNMLATPVGTLVGGQVYKSGGYLPVMMIGPHSMVLAWLWMYFYVKETKPLNPDISKKQMVRDIFRLDNIKASYKTCTQPRVGNLRLQIWLLVFVSVCLRLINIGTMAIGLSHVKTSFQWEVTQFANTTTIFSLVYAAATLTIVPFLSRKLMVHEAAVGLIGILSLMSKMILMAASKYAVILLFAWLAGSLFACAGIAVRSRISKLVSRQELGRVFSLLSTFESLTPVLGSSIMIQIQNSSLHFYPGLAYATAAVCLLPSAFIFTWMMKMPTMSLTQYQESEQSKTMKEMNTVDLKTTIDDNKKAVVEMEPEAGPSGSFSYKEFK